MTIVERSEIFTSKNVGRECTCIDYRNADRDAVFQELQCEGPRVRPENKNDDL